MEKIFSAQKNVELREGKAEQRTRKVADTRFLAGGADSKQEALSLGCLLDDQVNRAPATQGPL